MSGSIPVELGNLSNLEFLLLDDNTNLSGPLPGSFTGLGSLTHLRLDGTRLCAPTDTAFQAWLQGIANKQGVVNCSTPTIYWVDGYRVGKIQRTWRSGVEDLITNLNAPRGLALDPGAGKMYWTEISVVNSGTLHRGKIRRANLDGSGVEALVTGLGNPHHLAIDVGARKIYWTDGNSHKIQRANLDGSGVEDLVTLTGNGPTSVNNQHGLALDVSARKMYWTQMGSDYLWYANLDGSGVRYTTITGMAPPTSLALGGGYLYWTSTSGSERKIQRVKLDPTIGPTGGAQDLAEVSRLSFNRLALNIDAGSIYWTLTGRSGRRNIIQRANLDGTGVAIVVTELELPHGLAIDPGN